MAICKQHGYQIRPNLITNISTLIQQVHASTLTLSVQGRVIGRGELSNDCPAICFSDQGLRRFLSEFEERHADLINSADAIVVSTGSLYLS